MAAALGVDERDVAMAEIGTYAPPAEWRAKLIALAQETAHRALQTAGNLLWRDDECAVAGFSTGPTLPRFI
ncbi:MAG: hypothetical protein H7124_08840 [Phycisphaerales bacterium]|nr:hypothetical protein [Hyphomonadaceae bacterium]